MQKIPISKLLWTCNGALPPSFIKPRPRLVSNCKKICYFYENNDQL